jgi:hypothetical protein
MIGTDTAGTTNGFLTHDFNRTGGTGVIIDIGKNEERGVFKIIGLNRNNRDKNWGVKGNSNISRGLRFSSISARYSSNKDNPRFRSLNHKENPRLNNRHSNKGNPRFSNVKVHHMQNLKLDNHNNRSNPRLGNLKVHHKDNPRFSNLRSRSSPNSKDNLNHRVTNLRDSNPNNSTLDLRANRTGEDRNIRSLKKNLKEAR